MTTREQILRVFHRLEADGAFLPYYPEMLDFELPDNRNEELREINDYHAAFARDPDAALD